MSEFAQNSRVSYPIRKKSGDNPRCFGRIFLIRGNIPTNQWGFDLAGDSEGRGFSIYISNSEIPKSNFSWPSIRFASNSSEYQYWVDSLVVWVFLTCSLNLKSFSSINFSSVLEIMRSCGLQCFFFLFVEMCERIPSNIRGHYVSFFPSVWRGLDGGEKTSNHEGKIPSWVGESFPGIDFHRGMTRHYAIPPPNSPNVRK